MAFHTLGVHRALQPWRIAGLRHWLMDSEEAVQALSAPKRPATPTASPLQEPRRAVNDLSGSAPPSRPDAAPHRPVAPVRPAAPETRPVSQPAPPLPEAPATLPLNRWPDPWRELLTRCPRSSVALWTYPAMRDDYGGRSDPTRRALLQRLMRDLAMPPGSHAFWPMSAPPYGDPHDQRVDPLFFHSGLAELAPLVIIFFGPPPEELGLPPLSPLIPELYMGRRLVRVPSTDTLAANLRSGPQASPEGMRRHESLVQFLKSQLSGLISR